MGLEEDGAEELGFELLLPLAVWSPSPLKGTVAHCDRPDRHVINGFALDFDGCNCIVIGVLYKPPLKTAVMGSALLADADIDEEALAPALLSVLKLVPLGEVVG